MFGAVRLSSLLVILDFVTVGSLLSLQSLAHIGSGMPSSGITRTSISPVVLDFANVGSSLSLRSVARLGATISVWGGVRLASSMSVFDFALVGSSLSLRSIGRFGSSLSIGGTLVLGTGNLKFAALDAGIWGRNSDKTYTRRMSFPDGTGGNYEGILHGQWQADVAISTSDRRLKSSITPLHQTLLTHMSRAQEGIPETGELDPAAAPPRHPPVQAALATAAVLLRKGRRSVKMRSTGS